MDRLVIGNDGIVESIIIENLVQMPEVIVYSQKLMR